MTLSTPINFPAPLLLFGCGNMAGAMVDGWIAAGVQSSNFHIVKPTARNVPQGAMHYTSAAQTEQKYDTIMIGIKPAMLADMASDIRSLMAPGAMVISILGGVSSDVLARHFPGARTLRLMPNLAVALGKSPLGLYSSQLSDADKQAVEHWLAPLGSPYWIDAEGDMEAFTALAGCGPAFLYRFIAALGHAGEQIGLEKEHADRLAKEMIEGAALLAAQSPYNPGELAARVASKGGSTAAGLSVLDKDDALLQLMTHTLRASRDRSEQQGKEAE
jgi:pyrroline-5-carboxylate reductase